MANVEMSEFKGHKVIVLPMDEAATMKFTFGLSKAKIILRYIDEIQKFVDDNVKDDN